MRKIIYLTLLMLVMTLFSQAQTVDRCGTMEHHAWKMQNDPAYAKSFVQNEQILQNWIASHPRARTANTVPDTIPIVVHVIWKTAAQNISDAQVISQIDVLNEDFARKNADTVNTPAVWQSISGSLPYYFVLARRDPNGHPTTGIVHVQTSVTSFNTNDAVKFTAQGGDDAWDVMTYLNIWSCNLGGGLLGYGEFPTGTPSNTYGFVCLYDAFGRVGNVSAPYDQGRTTTHEIGHCFNLFHIWGDDGGACSGSDNVSDTPNQADATTTCETFPATDACATSSPGFMFMNYMDYSYDACLNMFTVGQATRMEAAITNFYPSIVNSDGIVPVNLQVNDAGIPEVVFPTGNSCNDSLAPIVTIKNWGSANLTAATINYRVDNNTLQTYSWTGNLASLATVNVTLPNAYAAIGSHTFTSYTTVPNGLSDPNHSNDTATSSFAVLSTGQAVPYTEAFTTVSFPPTGWSANNPDGATTWARATVSHGSGTGSLWMDNYNYNSSGEIDELISPNFNLMTVSNPQLTFYLAYQLYSDPTVMPNYSDTLEILISTDCGVSYTSIYKKNGTDLTTTSPVWAAGNFSPTAAQWRQEVVDLTPYGTSSNAVLKIRNITDYENNLYVDDINVDFASGVSANVKADLPVLYPSPTSGMVNIKFAQPVKGDVQINVFNSLGVLVYVGKVSSTNDLLRINLEQLESGIYTISLISESINKTSRVVIQK